MNYTASSLAEVPQTDGNLAAFEAIDVLGLCRLYRRPATLDGSIPLRGAQCKPFLDGNAAGIHLQLLEPALFSAKNEGLLLQFTDEALARVTSGYEDRVRNLAVRGLIEPGGYWWERLMEGFVTRRGEKLRFWTGWLVRPGSAGILVSRAYNRWSLVDVGEHVITGDRFVPLVLDLDGASVHSPETWLDTELAVLTPIESGLAISTAELEANPAVGRRVREFYSDEYLSRRADVKATGRYRTVVAQGEAPLAESGPCRITTVGSTNTIHPRTFAEYRDAFGVSREPAAGRFEFGVVESSGGASFRWDGNNLRDIGFDPPDLPDRCAAAWKSVYGEEPGERMAWWAAYLLPFLGPHRSEPLITFIPHAFAETPAGWSCVVDGYNFAGMPGMRGVIATDVFHVIAASLEIRAVGRLEIPRGSRLARLLPVPRLLLEAGFREIPLSEASQE